MRTWSPRRKIVGHLLKSRRTLKTGINELQSINYGMYVAEWQGYYNTGTAQIQIFEITTGGRVDGKPIDALEPPKVPGGQ